MKRAILLAAYGATGEKNAMHLNAFEQQVRGSFPACSVRWAFTSLLMRNRLAAARKKTDSVQKALRRLAFEKFTQVTVQSLHIIPGSEYADMLAEIEAARREGGPAEVSVGLPLLGGDGDVDIRAAAGAILQTTPAGRKEGDALVWVGHGSSHGGSAHYRKLILAAQELDRNILIGTLEDGLDDILPQIKKRDAKRVWLMPLLAVIGKHAAEDLSGRGPESWRSRLEANGLECLDVTRGMVEYPAFTDIWLRHLQRAVAPELQ